MKRLHGAHNKSVCDLLNLQDKVPCGDWVVTTAFYSAIHYLDHVLFPLTHNGREFKNINQAHQFISASSIHQTRKILIEKYLNKHAANYTFLIGECQNARYSDYNVNPLVITKSISKLNEIIKDCDINKKQK